jgi:hypothetical protein
MRYAILFTVLTALVVFPLAAQTPAPAPSPDAPSIKIGGVLYADYTYTASVAPPARDANGNEINPSSFNVSRVYINFLGTVNRYISYRITPEIVRETSSASSLSGSQNFRIKFAWAQVNLDQWLTKGSWVRVGLNQTPWLDYAESIYRYRFQGTTFVDREGFLFPSDAGITFHYNFQHDFGDVQAGIYNGEGWAHSEVNDQKAMQVRATLRPVPASPVLHGLRISGFYDADHYASGLPRNRALGQVTYEHPRVNAGIEVLSTTDRPSFTTTETKTHGSSLWATPKFGHGWEALLRRDTLHSDTAPTKTRDIEGIAYWFPLQSGVSSALLFDRDATRGPAAGTHITNYGIKVLLSF